MSAIVTTAPLVSAADGERRDDVADVGVLGQHDAVERRADQRLVERDLAPRSRFACAAAIAACAAGARRRAPCRSAPCAASSVGREMNFFLRADRASARRSARRRAPRRAPAPGSPPRPSRSPPPDRGCAATSRLSSRAITSSRFTRLPSSTPEPFQPSGRLGRDRRLALRDDVAGGVEQRHRLRRKGRADRGGFDRRRPADESPYATNPSDSQRRDARKPRPPAPARAPRGGGGAIDRELGDVRVIHP